MKTYPCRTAHTLAGLSHSLSHFQIYIPLRQASYAAFQSRKARRCIHNSFSPGETAAFPNRSVPLWKACETPALPFQAGHILCHQDHVILSFRSILLAAAYPPVRSSIPLYNTYLSLRLNTAQEAAFCRSLSALFVIYSSLSCKASKPSSPVLTFTTFSTS